MIRLFDPRRDPWDVHFRWDWPRIEAVSDTGTITIRLLRLNSSERVAERLQLGPARFLVIAGGG